MNMKISNKVMYAELGKEYLKDLKKIGKNLKDNYLLPMVAASMLYSCGNEPTKQNNTNVNNPSITNNAPIITSTPPFLEIMVKDNYIYDVNATDADGDALTYYLTQNPAGMMMDPVTGLIEFQTNYSDLGNNNIIAVADDGKSTTEQIFPLNVKYNYQGIFFPYPSLTYKFVKGSQDNEKVVVCEDSCSRTEDSFNNKANGIFLGSLALESMIGTRPFIGTSHDFNSFPIEFHLEQDTNCNSTQGGGSAQYSGRTPLICLYTYNKMDESSLNAQVLPIHEEAHMDFKERALFSGEENFVRAIAAVLTDQSGTLPNLDSFCDPRMANISQFVNDLCTRHGFDTNYIKPFFGELISRSQIKRDSLTTFEVRDILNDLTGYDTTQTFIDNGLYYNL